MSGFTYERIATRRAKDEAMLERARAVCERKGHQYGMYEADYRSSSTDSGDRVCSNCGTKNINLRITGDDDPRLMATVLVSVGVGVGDDYRPTMTPSEAEAVEWFGVPA